MKGSSRREFLTTTVAALPFSLATAARGADPSAFRLAVTTDEIDDEITVALDFLGRFGLGHCEIRRIWNRYNTDWPLDKIRYVRRMLDESGIQLAILDTSFFKIKLPRMDTVDGSESLREQWDLLERAFERADVLGTDLIRVFGFMHEKGGQPDEAAYPRIYDLVEEATERAAKAGFRLALENVGDSYIATAAHSAKLLDAVKSPALGLTWDPNNSARAGDPEPFPRGYNSLDSRRILHVHVRDYRRQADGSLEWCGVGDGEFDHVGQLRALQRDGYGGSVSLETHFTLNGSKAKASEHSLKGLLKAVAQV